MEILLLSCLSRCRLAIISQLTWPQLLAVTNFQLNSVKSKSKLRYDRRSVGNSLKVSTPSGAPGQIFLLLDSYGFVDMRREDRSVVYNCCWSSPAQLLSGQGPAGLMITFYCLRFETPQLGGLGPCTYIPQKQGGPVIFPGTGFPFRRLLRLAELWCRFYRQSVRPGTKPR
jgi:hypothetical protein